MTMETWGLGQRVVDLRRAFDEGFGAPPRGAPEETVDLLAIRIAGDAYALKIGDLVSLAPSGRVVPLPSRQPGLLGLTGIRGSVLPVYGLGLLLGYESAHVTLRWLALAGGAEPVALAFDELEGFLRVNRTELCVDVPRRNVREAVRAGNVTRMIVDTASLVAALKAKAGEAGATKET
jgi:chemotaxis signal transduction protein